MPNAMRIFAAALLSGFLAACGAAESPNVAGPREIVIARGQLDDHIAECTKRFGYDPEAASKLGANVLGPGELEWRACVYQGIEKYVIPKTQSPEMYRRAIAEDRKMTDAVANGQTTRAQRRARVQQLLEEFDRVEEANRAKLQTQASERLVKEELQRQQDMMRRTLSPLTR